MVGFYGKMNMMRYQVCTQIDRRKKLMVSKFDNLQKHFRRWKCKVTRTNCIVGQSYMSMESQHAKMITYPIEKGMYSIANMVVMGDVVGERSSYNLLPLFGF
jgi:hypothetical protein